MIVHRDMQSLSKYEVQEFVLGVPKGIPQARKGLLFS